MRGRGLHLVVASLMLLLQIVIPISIPPANAASSADFDSILITSDAEFDSAHGVSGGIGSKADPFIMEGLNINPKNYSGIQIRDTRSFFVIRDTRCPAGLHLGNVTGGRLENLTSGATSITECGGVAVSNTSAGYLHVSQSRNVSVTNCKIEATATNLGSFSSDNTKDLFVTHTAIDGYISLDFCDGVYLHGNNQSRISARVCSNMTVEDNFIANRGPPYNQSGMDFGGCRDSMVINNSIAGSSEGISLLDYFSMKSHYRVHPGRVCMNMSVVGNRIQNCDDAISCYYTTSSTLSDNVISDCSNGIRMENCSKLSIQRNEISNCAYGLYTLNGSDIQISDNKYVNCTTNEYSSPRSYKMSPADAATLLLITTISAVLVILIPRDWRRSKAK